MGDGDDVVVVLQGKCAQYWPSSGQQEYGELSVAIVSENHLVDHTVRSFALKQVCDGFCFTGGVEERR